MNSIKKPLSLTAQGAKKNIYDYAQNKALKLTCQSEIAFKIFIHSNLIKILVFQRIADVIIIFIGLIGEVCHA